MNLRKRLRKESAVKRQEIYKQLTTAQKIALLNMKLGIDKGAVKQRTKLAITEIAEQAVKQYPKVMDKLKDDKKPYSKLKKS